YYYRILQLLPSFPTRRSSDLFGFYRSYIQVTRTGNTFERDVVQKTAGVTCDLTGPFHSRCRRKQEDVVQPGGIQRLLQYSHFFRSEEHTSELQSRENLVCRLL